MMFFILMNSSETVVFISVIVISGLFEVCDFDADDEEHGEEEEEKEKQYEQQKFSRLNIFLLFFSVRSFSQLCIVFNCCSVVEDGEASWHKEQNKQDSSKKSTITKFKINMFEPAPHLGELFHQARQSFLEEGW